MIRSKVAAVRDTQELRHRLWLTLALSPSLVAPTLSGCTEQPQRATDKGAAGKRERSTTKGVYAAKAATPPPSTSSSSAPVPGVPERGTPQVEAAEPAPVAGYQLGDPPLVEGYDPEEETCVRGNWCGTVEQALLLAAPKSETHSSGCPQQLMGRAPGEVDLTLAAYRGLSSKRAMRGTFQPWNTQRERTDKKRSDWCCYHWFDYCSGRPLLGEPAALSPDAAALANHIDGRMAGWHFRQSEVIAPDDALSPIQRAALAEHFVRDADDEHSSIAAFARAVLELLQVGAPAQLVGAHQRAMAEEIEHAQALYGQAQRFGVHDAGPCCLPVLAQRFVDLAALARHTFMEACIGETIAALRGLRQARTCQDRELAEIWQRIANEEAEHAALGWQTLVWARTRLEELGTSQALDHQLLAVLRECEASCTESPSSRHLANELKPVASYYGLLDEPALAEVVQQAVREIIVPTLQAILTGNHRAFLV